MTSLIRKQRSFARTALFGAALLCSLFVRLERATAEFIRTAAGVYQNTTHLDVKVMITERGIFVLRGQEIDLQTFHPEQVAPKGVDHFFLAYDIEQNRYSKLHVGEKKYPVQGSFTLLLGNLRVTVDNNNPYCSIVIDDTQATGRDPDILGVLGLEVIVNRSGNLAVALLEANQFNQYRGKIFPYVLRDGGLLLKGVSVTGAGIGLALEPSRSSCLRRDTLLIRKPEIEAIQKLDNTELRKRKLEKLLKENSLKDFSKSLFILRTDQRSVVGLSHDEDSRIYILRPYKSGNFCVVEDVALH